MTDLYPLEARDALPEALRVLLAEYPREAWQANPNFSGLVQFWLERHVMFRRLIAAMQTDSEGLIERKLDPQDFARRLARYGSTFVTELHGHHHIEDAHYFPVLARTEPPIARGFEILDRDHQALDLHLDDFTKHANRVIGAEQIREASGSFLKTLKRLEHFLERHLTDEEDLIVPIILKHGEAGLG